MRWWVPIIMLAAFAGTGLALGVYQWVVVPRTAGSSARPSLGSLFGGPLSGGQQCKGLEGLNPVYADLDVEELERRYVDQGIMSPSLATDSLRTFDTSLEAYDPKQRACSRRVMLIHSVASHAKMRERGGDFWFLAHESPELEAIFLGAPLDKGWSTDQRNRALDHARMLSSASAVGSAPADLEYSRRTQLGQLIGCEATQVELDRIGGRRPRSCANLGSVVIAGVPGTPAPTPARRAHDNWGF
jgi:hypothetical protein